MKKKTTPTISIIVPVYNIAPYLRDCLDSIISQSFKDWEMLLVDDGSTDESGNICDIYAGRDHRVRVFHQKNAGLSAARNKALDNASGQYYTMVDSDDILATPDYLKILLDLLQDNASDMSACGHIWFSDGAPIPAATDLLPDTRICSGKEFYFLRGFPKRTDCSDAYGNTVSIGYSRFGAHGKLYKRELFENVRYPVGHVLEDLATAHRIYLQSERIAVSGKLMYAYRRRENGILRSTERDRLIREEIYAYNDLLSFAMEIGDTSLTDHALMRLRWILRNKT